jgi:peptide/nickel transport system substrate-binding protein
LQIRPLESAAFFAALRAAEHQTFAINVFYNNADVLYFYFHSRQRPAPNRFDWADPRTDELLEKSRSTLDEGQRLQIYEELQRIVHQNALWVPLTHDLGVLGVSRRTGGVRVHPSTWLYKFLDLYLKAGQR